MDKPPRKAPGSKQTAQSALIEKLQMRKKMIEKVKQKEMETEQALQKKEREDEEITKKEEERKFAEKEAKKKAKKESIAQAKKDGTYLTPKQRELKENAEIAKKALISEGILKINKGDKVQNKNKPKAKKQLKKGLCELLIEPVEPKSPSAENETNKNVDNDDRSNNPNEASSASESIGDWDEDEDSSETQKTIETKIPKNTENDPKIPEKAENGPKIPKNTENEPKIPKNTENEPKITKNSETPAKTSGPLRSPIICVLGHVDTGKTKLLDRMRNTSVQSHEVGGITQQIGASFFPKSFLEAITAPLDTAEAHQSALRLSELFKSTSLSQTANPKTSPQSLKNNPKNNPKTGKNNAKTGKNNAKTGKNKQKESKPGKNSADPPAPEKWDCRLPGLLVIDTPGHESFSNLRKRGSSLCDMAVLVVDIMHGVEPQTAESVQLLRRNKTPFVIALNKLDRLFGWRAADGAPFAAAMAAQGEAQRAEFRRRLAEAVAQVAALGLNAALFCENPDPRGFASVVPTSALTGEGVPDLLRLLADCCQARLAARLEAGGARAEGVVLEVRNEEGLGHTADVVLSSGTLREGDCVVLGGFEGAIETRARCLYLPAPLRETRFRGEFCRVRSVDAAAGVKICAAGLDRAVAGSRIVVCVGREEVEEAKEEIISEFENILGKVVADEDGVSVQCSTLGAMEAFLEYLSTEKIPVARVSLGNVRKKDVTAASVMCDKAPQYASILAFNVKVEKEILQYAEEQKVKIFQGEIIYNLRDMFVAYLEKFKKAEKKRKRAVFPVVMDILPEFIIMKHWPIILGCKIEEGRLVKGTPIAAIKPDAADGTENFVLIGKVKSMEKDKKIVSEAKPGDKVAVKIAQGPEQSNIYYGRQFDHRWKLCSFLTRESIDQLKEDYRDDLSKNEWKLVISLKKLFGIG